MGEACACYTWTYRPTLSIVVILSIMACMVHCSETPAAIVGELYPRGNHWAVGHFMGKKSVDDLSGVGDSDPNGDYLTTLGREDKLLDRLLRALVNRESPGQLPAGSDGLDLLESSSSSSSRRMEEERRDRYLREMSQLLLLALKLNDSGSR